MTTLERLFIRSLMSIVAIALLTGAFWGPTKLAQALLAAGLPQAGEVVPRQIPYRGYVEQNGTPLTSAGVPMRFRLYGIDGGVLHEESQTSVVVQQGNFSVELGDATAFAPEVLRQNFLELEVAIGSPPVQLLGRQRLLTAPFTSTSGYSWKAGQAATLDTSADVPPAGTAIAFTGPSCPTGYLYADGAAISRTTYARLFLAIGTTWGAGDGSTTFNLPNLQGSFLRGDGSQTLNGVAYAGGNVGSRQADSFQGHYHSSSPNRATLEYIAPGGGGSFGAGGNYINATGLVISSPITDGVNGPPRTQFETRPFNAAVKYCVRF